MGLLGLGLILIVAIGSGCLFFDSKNAESPLQDSGGRIPPLTPADLLTQLSEAITQRNANLYLLEFDNSTSYRYYPDDESRIRYGVVLDSFDISREQQFAKTLLSRSNLPIDSVAETDFNLRSELPGTDGVQVEFLYRIQLGTVLSIPRAVSGRAVLNLIRGSDGGYVIQTWHDYRQGSEPTIAEWKGSL